MGFYHLQLQGSFSRFYLLEYTSLVWITFQCRFLSPFPSLRKGKCIRRWWSFLRQCLDVFVVSLAPLKRLCWTFSISRVLHYLHLSTEMIIWIISCTNSFLSQIKNMFFFLMCQVNVVFSKVAAFYSAVFFCTVILGISLKSHWGHCDGPAVTQYLLFNWIMQDALFGDVACSPCAGTFN